MHRQDGVYQRIEHAERERKPPTKTFTPTIPNRFQKQAHEAAGEAEK
jgi:hypothetical protein